MFEQFHRAWVSTHLSKRRGESKRRLEKGHAYAEKQFLRCVWWPAFGQFDYLHPEYEVHDFFDGSRYLDFAYIRSGVRLGIEVDPYGTHYEKLDRTQYANQWVRHMHLLNDGWLISRISLDDVKERPRMWQQLFQQMIGQLFGSSERMKDEVELSSRERDILRLALRLDRPIKLHDVQTLLQCGYDKARSLISLLESKKWLVAMGKGTRRAHAWRVDVSRRPPLL
ncbi:DNA-binding response regulator [Paenibacillus aestuarii]|uniref:DNA-binding response regulator n=1 Tax=Paenibacillus aestuarii TaxID=516965 RepID=A0ABW0K2H5_9BACL|nr:DNA-binding response regulator [Paenibacillus aestuarii]